MAALGALSLVGKIAAAASGASTLVTTAGALKSASAQEKAAEFNAKQMEAAGKAELAEATIEAENERRRKDLMMSRARAVGAASGGGIDIDLMGDIEEEGVLNEQRIIWGGKERRAGRNAQAASSRFAGQSKKRAGILDAGSSLLSGGKSFYEVYG